VPENAHTQGSDGGQRHGDTAIAGMLAVAAAEGHVPSYGYTPASADDALIASPLAEEAATHGRRLW
jgi:hypothetical protein